MASKRVDGAGTLTAQQYAAIHLRVPNSGLDWLDDMIRESRELDSPAQTECQASKKASAKKPASAKETTS